MKNARKTRDFFWQFEVLRALLAEISKNVWFVQSKMANFLAFFRNIRHFVAKSYFLRRVIAKIKNPFLLKYEIQDAATKKAPDYCVNTKYVYIVVAEDIDCYAAECGDDGTSFAALCKYSTNQWPEE